MNLLRSIPLKLTSLKTQGTKPPSTPPPMCGLGPFCIKAVCEMQNSSGEPVAEFVGYDTEYSILEKTKRECQKKANGNYCTVPKMTAIPSRNVNNCNGHIVYKNFETNLTSIIFPK